ncbi:MAG TPA: NAD-dependent deacylase [Thermoanaerobaculia bacterium]
MQESLERAIDWIEQHRPRRIAALTGAGISAESGIPTFRDAGGLWENYRAEELATPEAFARDPRLVWRWYEWRRGIIREAAPNDGHLALAALEAHLAAADGALTLITQNVDGLHRRAGSRNVIELHGNIFRVRCTREGTREERIDAFETRPPLCACGATLRPDVVWFGEMLPPGAIEQAAAAVADSDLLLVIGTSGVVHPAAGLVSMLRRGQAIEVNPQETPISRLAHLSVHAPAAVALPPLAAAIERSFG